MKLPENFESYSEARKNGFLKMKELKDAGQKIVGTYCSFVPTELVEAAGVIDSVAARVSNLLIRYGADKDIVLTGGLCDSPYFLEVFSGKVKREVKSHFFARYAGALGAALTAAKKTKIQIG